MDKQQRPLTDRELRALLATGATDRGIGEGLTFVASASAARNGRATWILRFRLNGRAREKVLGRYPEMSLKDAREQARKDRMQIERGVDVAAVKQAVKARLVEIATVRGLGERWHERYIQKKHKHPEVVLRVLQKHIFPVIGSLAPKDVGPMHVELVLNRAVANNAPTMWDLASKAQAKDAPTQAPAAAVAKPRKRIVMSPWREAGAARASRRSNCGQTPSPRL